MGKVTNLNYFCFISLPKDPRLRPSIANGHLGTAVHSHGVFMNGLYCGAGGDSHRAWIPSTCSLKITEAEPPTNFSRQYSLNVGEGKCKGISIDFMCNLWQFLNYAKK